MAELVKAADSRFRGRWLDPRNFLLEKSACVRIALSADLLFFEEHIPHCSSENTILQTVKVHSCRTNTSNPDMIG
jgi:hypothetical protein